MAEYILGIDMGTTSMKVAVYDFNGQQQKSAVVEYSLLTPSTNFVEAPCEIYLDAIAKCMDKIRAKGFAETDKCVTVSFSVQGETFFVLDEACKPLRNAVVWMDNRAGKQADELRERFGNKLCYEVTGQVSFEACWPAAKLLWIKENEPEIWAKVRHIVLLEDYIIYLLTGKFAAEGSLLTSTEYWDIRTKRYWPEMLEYLGIDEAWLPEIKESGEPVGIILPEMAELLGISPKALICTGCLDQAAGAIGVGNIRPGIFSENIGAALAICVPTKTLTYDPKQLMPVHYFAVPNTYMMHTFTTGGMFLRWFRDGFCQPEKDMEELTEIDAYDLLNEEAATVAPGADGLIALPHLQGSMAPDVNLNAKAVFYGATLKHRKPHFIRAIMESLGFIISRNLEAISDMGLEVEQIRTMGGGSKSEIWNQIKADITGKTLNVTYSSQDTACLGAAILAGTATGVFESIDSAVANMVQIRKSYIPDMKNHEMYLKQYRKFNLLFKSLTELFDVDACDKK